MPYEEIYYFSNFMWINFFTVYIKIYIMIITDPKIVKVPNMEYYDSLRKNSWFIVCTFGGLACEVVDYLGRASIYNFNLMFVYS